MKTLYVYTGYTQSTTDDLQMYIESQGFKVVNITYGNDNKRSRKLISAWCPQDEYDCQQLVNVSSEVAEGYSVEIYNTYNLK